MHTIKLDIDDTIYSKFMTLLDLMPKGKIKLQEDTQIDTSMSLSKHFDTISSEDNELLKKLAE